MLHLELLQMLGKVVVLVVHMQEVGQVVPQPLVVHFQVFLVFQQQVVVVAVPLVLKIMVLGAMVVPES